MQREAADSWPCAYQAGSGRILSDTPLNWLAPWQLAGAPWPRQAWAAGTDEPINGWAEAEWEWPTGQRRRVRCAEAAEGCRLEVGGIGRFQVQAGGLALIERAAAASNEELVMAALGPAWLLALAWRGVFGLHAACADWRDRQALFVGASGRGKSTLADYLGTRPGWQPTADDIALIGRSMNGPIIWPRYPQLKWPAGRQPSAEGPAALGPVYWLGADSAEITLTPLSPRQAVLTLTRHTVPGRLFGPRLLRAHLEFCVALVMRSNVWRLDYPRRYAALPEVVRLVEEHLLGGSADHISPGRPNGTA